MWLGKALDTDPQEQQLVVNGFSGTAAVRLGVCRHTLAGTLSPGSVFTHCKTLKVAFPRGSRTFLDPDPSWEPLRAGSQDFCRFLIMFLVGLGCAQD